MTEIGEGIVELEKFMESDVKCNYKPDKEEWKANLDGSSTALGENLGKKPDAKSAKDLSGNNWPSQAHHLIPWKQLKAHPVAGWLSVDAKDSQIFDDTFYNVDHKNNGKWMPYASRMEDGRY